MLIPMAPGSTFSVRSLNRQAASFILWLSSDVGFRRRFLIAGRLFAKWLMSVRFVDGGTMWRK